MIFRWRIDAVPVEMSQSISLPEYVITAVSHMVCTTKFNSTGGLINSANLLTKSMLTDGNNFSETKMQREILKAILVTMIV